MFKIPEFLKKLFPFGRKKQELPPPTQEIGISMYMPKREELSSEDIEEVERLKKKYRQKLNTQRILVSNDIIDIEIIKKNIKQYQDLVSKVVIDNPKFQSVNISELTDNELTRILIDFGKSFYYYGRYEELGHKSSLELLAIYELYQEFVDGYSARLKQEKRRRGNLEEFIDTETKKSNALASAVNLLNNVVSTFEFEKVGINLSLQPLGTFVREKHDDIQRHISRYFLEDLVNKYSEWRKYLFPTYEIPEMKPLNKVMYFEELLEEYVYGNYEIELPELDKRLEQLENKTKTPSTKDKLLEEYEYLKIKYNIYNTLGRKLVDRSIMLRLYRVKFDILTADIDRNKQLFKGIDEEEQKYFNEILKKMLLELIDEKQPAKLQAIFGTEEDVYKQVIEKLRKVFYKYDHFSYKDYSAREIEFLIALYNGEDSLNEFFNKVCEDKHYISCYEVDNKIYNDYLKWNDKAPLSSMYQIQYSNTRSRKVYLDYNSLAEFYDLFVANQIKQGKCPPMFEGVYSITDINKYMWKRYSYLYGVTGITISKNHYVYVAFENSETVILPSTLCTAYKAGSNVKLLGFYDFNLNNYTLESLSTIISFINTFESALGEDVKYIFYSQNGIVCEFKHSELEVKEKDVLRKAEHTKFGFWVMIIAAFFALLIENGLVNLEDIKQNEEFTEVYNWLQSYFQNKKSRGTL